MIIWHYGLVLAGTSCTVGSSTKQHQQPHRPLCTVSCPTPRVATVLNSSLLSSALAQLQRMLPYTRGSNPSGGRTHPFC